MTTTMLNYHCNGDSDVKLWL